MKIRFRSCFFDIDVYYTFRARSLVCLELEGKLKMKKADKIIIVIFLSIVIVYSIIVSFFTSTVHINVDEELYIALARSFHYEDNWCSNNVILNISNILIGKSYFK